MSKLSDLIVGKIVTDIRHSTDYVTLLLGDGSFLNVYNSFDLEELSFDEESRPVVDYITEEDSNITIFFSPQGFLKIGMRDVDFRGPEAMSYREDRELIVWP